MGLIKDENYFQVCGWMLNRLKLKGTDLQIYSIIYGFTQNADCEFTGSLQYLSEFTGTSKPTVIKALKYLVSANLIIKNEIVINNVTFCKYKANLQAVNNFDTGSKETLTGGGKETLLGGSKENLYNNILSDNKGVNNIDTINNIVLFLNTKAGTAYKPNSKATQRYINARLNEGFSVMDFYKVINKKVAEWKGGKMEQYLRPETLFGTKFESYLNSKTVGANGVVIDESMTELDDLF